MSDITGLSDLSIFSLIIHADFFVQLIMLFLLLASIFSWSIIIEKWIILRQQCKKVKDFNVVLWSQQSLERACSNLTECKDNLIIRVISTGMSAAKEYKECKEGNYMKLRDVADQAMCVEYQKFHQNLERNVDMLATIGSSAPFIGLLGTVWGIMHSFQSIALTNNTSLAVVAPSIAESLLATAVGLLVSIPAVIFYNRTVIKIQNLSQQVNDCIIKAENILFQSVEN